jgi:peptidoglycan/xylan/chitin deacetylase (PgdA/CDA1 family)
MMSRLRHTAHYLLAAALYYSGALALRCWFRRIVKRRSEVAVLGLHRILSAQQAALTCSESAMVITLPTFKKLLPLLGRQFHVLTLSDLLCGNIPQGSKPSCLLTFDDAWLDTFQNAYPALREAGLRATVFVPTGLLAGNGFCWVERLSLLWRNCGENRKEICCAVGDGLGQAPTADLPDAIAAFKRVSAVRRELILQALATRFANGQQLGEIDQLMSWEQLLAMAPVLEAASHGVSHVLLDCEEEATAKRELRESRRTLEKKTGKEVRSFAYPSGSFNDRVREWAADAGYQWAFTTRPGSYRAGDDPLAVPRSLLQEGNLTSPWGSFSPAMFHFRLAGWR